MNGEPDRREAEPANEDPAWLVHLYRALSADSTTWRGRLDVTANWAVPLVIALVTFALGERALPHLVLLVLGWGVIALAVYVEARRYRVVHHAIWRTRQIERGFFAPRLAGEATDPSWRTELATDLRSPRPTIGFWPAVKARMRRVYLVLTYLLFLAWIAKVFVHPRPARSADEVLERLSIAGVVPPWVVVACALLVLAAATAVVVRSPSAARLEERRHPPTAAEREPA
jgi:uncharacterized membrane protein